MAVSPLLHLGDRDGVIKVTQGQPRPRRRALDPLLFEVDLERLVQRARIFREEELISCFTDAGDGVPHPAQVSDRLEDRHEHIIREVVDGLWAVVVDRERGGVVERRGELAGVEGFFGHRFGAGVLLFCF